MQSHRSVSFNSINPAHEVYFSPCILDDDLASNNLSQPAWCWYWLRFSHTLLSTSFSSDISFLYRLMPTTWSFYGDFSNFSDLQHANFPGCYQPFWRESQAFRRESQDFLWFATCPAAILYYLEYWARSLTTSRAIFAPRRLPRRWLPLWTRHLPIGFS